MDDVLSRLAARAGTVLQARGWHLASAESCTGGALAQAVTGVAGSSAWFERGFVVYSNAAKSELLGVREATLTRHGAVSRETVTEMALGVLDRSPADLAVAVSGIAGPGGGTPDKPVGTVWLALALRGQGGQARRHQFDGDRPGIRRQAVLAALREIIRAGG